MNEFAKQKEWTRAEIASLYHQPLITLMHQAAEVHREFQDPSEVQVSSLISIKTGGCPEDCSYCPQSAKYQTGLKAHKLLQTEEVIAAAKKAKEGGASRLCMGAAWREVRNNSDFDRVLDMVKEVNNLGMEVCATLGMLNQEQAQRLKDAGLYAYNHNIDSSEDQYKKIITTRHYDDRLNTLGNVRKAKLSVCSGGIIGLGETDDDRIDMLYTLSQLHPVPESIPINTLVAVKGTPLEDQPPVPVFELVRMIATARIVFPTSMVRLSAGRLTLSDEAQALCFMCGANSIFSGDILLTTPNPGETEDAALFKSLGLKAMEPFKHSSNDQYKKQLIAHD